MVLAGQLADDRHAQPPRGSPAAGAEEHQVRAKRDGRPASRRPSGNAASPGAAPFTAGGPTRPGAAKSVSPASWSGGVLAPYPPAAFRSQGAVEDPIDDPRRLAEEAGGVLEVDVDGRRRRTSSSATEIGLGPEGGCRAGRAVTVWRSRFKGPPAIARFVRALQPSAITCRPPRRRGYRWSQGGASGSDSSMGLDYRPEGRRVGNLGVGIVGGATPAAVPLSRRRPNLDCDGDPPDSQL